ncbi:MAG: hypothetical protein JWO37_1915 [Acidimicrobiales bacterium]|jgi:hypothetical protein|nr:hypothetical protein [Acidimicrobiales bacterium]
MALTEGPTPDLAARHPASAAAVLVLVAAVSISGCSRITRHFSGSSTTRKGTLVISPATGPPGTHFVLEAHGLRAGEPMTFAVDLPNHTHFVGPPHTADPTGAASGTYTPQSGNPAGSYRVHVVGSQGTRADGQLRVTAAPSTTTPG